MKTKSFTSLILIVLVLAGLAYVLYFKQAKKAEAPVQETKEQEEVQKQEENSKNIESVTEKLETTSTTKSEIKTKTDLGQGTFSDGSEMDAPPPDILVVEVVHDGIKFSPNRVNIKLGDVVIFKNKSLVDILPISVPKEAYPEFDAKEPIVPGSSWNFKFTKSGEWKYKDAANGAILGVINVEK